MSTTIDDIFSCFILVLILAYSAHKAIKIGDVRNPTMNKNVVPNFFSSSQDDLIDFNDSDFKMAF